MVPKKVPAKKVSTKKAPAKREYEVGESFPEHIGWIRHRLRLFREKRGFTQTQLADRMGAVRGRVTDLERTDKRMSDLRVGTLFRFMKAMGISPGKFFAGCPGFGIPDVSSVIVTNEEDVILSLSGMLNEAQIKNVLKLLKKDVD